MRNIILASVVGLAVYGCASQTVDRLEGNTSLDVDAGSGTPNLGGKQADAAPIKIEPELGNTTFYVHTNTELFEVDPTKPETPMKKLGAFDCVGKGNEASSITDVAVDKSGRIFLVASPSAGSGKSLAFLDVKVEDGVVKCAGKGVALNTESVLMGATFAPEGTVLPDAEALVIADKSGDLYEVDTTTAETTLLGTFGSVPKADAQGNTYASKNVGTRFVISGDIVFMSGNGKPVGFATVRDLAKGTGTANKIDTLVEIDMSKLRPGNTKSVVKKVTGQVLKADSCTDTQNSYGALYGIAAFGTQIYGFSHSIAQMVSIDNSTGAACLVADESDRTTGGFSGAGVTTSVQVTVPVK